LQRRDPGAPGLDAKKYPKEMHQFLIDLMEKFELCFRRCSFGSAARCPAGGGS
jgi:hypothetical protein